MEDILMEIIESAKVEALDELEKEAKCGMDELVEKLADEEAAYWEMKAEVHYGL